MKKKESEKVVDSGLEFLKALNLVTEEKGISKDLIIDAMKQALMTAYKKNYDARTNVRVDFDELTGKFKVISYYVVVDDYIDSTYETDEEGNEIEIPPEINPDAQMLLEDAKEIDPDIKVGDTIEKEVTPHDFGRVAASTAKQVVVQKIREAERNSIMAEFGDKQDELLIGTVALEDTDNYYIDLGRCNGILPKKDIIPGEKIEMGSQLKVYVTKVEAGTKGPLILLSRKHYGFVKRLFESEIPELADGTVILYQVAREPGIRSKVAVYSTNDKVDAIGACIGARGSRIANILKELNGEKVDLVKYSNDPAEFIKNAMAPAKNVIVSIKDEEKREALVVVDNDNLKLAIGRKAINVRLASKLTRYKLEVKTMEDIQKECNK